MHSVARLRREHGVISERTSERVNTARWRYFVTHGDGELGSLWEGWLIDGYDTILPVDRL